ncbi:hypothetical protein EDB83DRAFT_2528395 [Lactarius deliciosus]|nr:hypothetical protein EDB83DRAFT_2528395 [Lactarius deliciosus]
MTRQRQHDDDDDDDGGIKDDGSKTMVTTSTAPTTPTPTTSAGGSGSPPPMTRQRRHDDDDGRKDNSSKTMATTSTTPTTPTPSHRQQRVNDTRPATMPGAINLRNVISVISDEIDTFIADELPSDVMEILQQTLSIIARDIVQGRGSADEDPYMEQVLYFHSISSIVADAGGPDWLKYRLEWILSQLPTVEDRRRLRRGDSISDGLLSEYGTDHGTDDSSLRSSD